MLKFKRKFRRLKVIPVKTCLRTPGSVEEQLHSFVTSAVDTGVVSFTIRPLYPGERATRFHGKWGRVCLRADLETTLCSTCREHNVGFSITETSSFNEVPCPISAVLSKKLGLASRLQTILFILHTRPFPTEVSSSLRRFCGALNVVGGYLQLACYCQLLSVTVCAVTASYCLLSYCQLLS